MTPDMTPTEREMLHWLYRRERNRQARNWILGVVVLLAGGIWGNIWLAHHGGW